MARHGLKPALSERVAALGIGNGGLVSPQNSDGPGDGLLDQPDGVPDHQLRREIGQLSAFVKVAKAALLEVRPLRITDEYIPTASGELGAVMSMTEEATHKSLEAVGQIEATAADLPESASESIAEVITRIFEASDFQDITGQRISKVLKMLQKIETRVGRLVDMAGEYVPRDDLRGGDEDEQAGDDFLGGPQLPEDAHDQDDIDALMASFD